LRPGRQLEKTGLETRFETESKSKDSITIANRLRCNKKFIKEFQMLGSKVTFEKIKQSVVSDANEDAKLIENHKWPHATTTLNYI